MLSYWENNEKRIKYEKEKKSLISNSISISIRSQMAVQIDDNGTSLILPRVVVAGTVTRRAVEPTWLTASNAQVWN